MTRLLRIGILGAAKIAPSALIEPAKRRDDTEVVAVAARDRRRAEEYAHQHGIDRVWDDYRSLLHDPNVDAVYIPLPNGAHGRWTKEALEHGKPVLCEKPFAANASEARAVVAAADRAGLVAMEAFHYDYHPLTQRWRTLVADGAVGTVVRVEASFKASIPEEDVRYRIEHAGGALMDLGCYCVHAVRFIDCPAPRVVRAEAKEGPRGIDVAMEAEVNFGGVEARVECDMGLDEGFAAELRVIGEEGEIAVRNPFVPHLGHRLIVSGKMELDTEVAGRTSYDHQLAAFVDAVRGGAPARTSGADAVANMALIDAVYEAAGLGIRQPTPRD